MTKSLMGLSGLLGSLSAGLLSLYPRASISFFQHQTMSAFNRDAQGVYLITVTPFTDSGALDLASTDRMVDFCLESGVTGLTILGIMGEAPKLTMEESRTFVKQVLQRVKGAVPVVVGASSPGFAPMKELTQSVMDLGADGVMVAG